MSTEELSDRFDTLINSYSSSEFSQNPLSFDEYEKSLFLTQAQEEVMEGLYTGKLSGDSFEDTEQLRRYLADLVKTATIEVQGGLNGLSDKSVFATLPPDLWFITYESVTLNGSTPCTNGKEVQVIPVTQDEYHRIKGNPFRRPNSRKALRLDVDESRVELISNEDIGSYLVRYVSRPAPIILSDLPDNLTINGANNKTECNLNPGIYRIILELAVKLAVRSRTPNTGK